MTRPGSCRSNVESLPRTVPKSLFIAFGAQAEVELDSCPAGRMRPSQFSPADSIPESALPSGCRKSADTKTSFRETETRNSTQPARSLTRSALNVTAPESRKSPCEFLQETSAFRCGEAADAIRRYGSALHGHRQIAARPIESPSSDCKWTNVTGPSRSISRR